MSWIFNSLFLRWSLNYLVVCLLFPVVDKDVCQINH